ncbi:MAG: hypothetical protein HQ510_01710, partial [Candidatus Marinimicrobia bacterium]|nr:hypothetical protein [Candidatus Neomarinimicrobiota bacterium]
MNLLRQSFFIILLTIGSLSFGQDVILTFGSVDVDAGTVEVYMQNSQPVYGFQFTVTNIDLMSATGGTAAANGFFTSINSSGLVLGFSMGGGSVPAGEGVLTNLSINGLVDPDAQMCYSGVTMSGANGAPLTSDASACYPDTEPEDCAGVPGGPNYLDDCGVCDDDPANDNADMDCNSECFGTAYNNECGCVEGSTDLTADFCYGCTDDTAINFDPDATLDDGSCEYETLIDAPANLMAEGGDGMITLNWDAVGGTRADVTAWISNVTDTGVEIS